MAATKAVYLQVQDELGADYSVPTPIGTTPTGTTGTTPTPINNGASVTVSAKGISKTMKYGIIGLVGLVVVVLGFVIYKRNNK